MNNQAQELKKSTEFLDQFYEYIWYKDQIFNRVLNIQIPDTIIIKNEMIEKWYFMNSKNEIKKKTKSKLNVDELINFFQKKNDYDVVASYRYIKNQQLITLFLTQEEIIQFLQNKKPGNGVLQHFVKSQGLYNTVLKIEWTEYVLLFEKLQSLRMMNDSKSNVYERFVTHEQCGFSVNVSTLNGSLLNNMLQQKTTEMIQHIRNITNGEIKIKRLVAYYKMNQKNQLIFLYTNEIELENNQIFQQIKKSIPEQVDLKQQSMGCPNDILIKYTCSSCIQNFTKSGVITIVFSQIYDYLIFQQENGDDCKKIKKLKIPQIIQNICPWLKDNDYLKLKDNVEFQKKKFLICHKCYFQIQDARDPSQQKFPISKEFKVAFPLLQKVFFLNQQQKIRIRSQHKKQNEKSELTSYKNDSTQDPQSESFIKGPLQKKFQPVLDGNKTQYECIKVNKQELLNNRNVSFFDNSQKPTQATSICYRNSKSISLYSKKSQQ